MDIVDKVDRRGLLECMGWAGTAAVFTLAAGVPGSKLLGGTADAHAYAPAGGLNFLQISDTHVGFSKAANPDPLATLRETVARVRAMPVRPDFALHSGDVTHLAKPEQFDTARALLSELGMPIHFVPGEHDILDGTDPRPFLAQLGTGAQGDGWYSFDAGGAHFIGLVNVVHLADKGMGSLGAAQLEWLKRDVAGLSSSTPIVVFSHFPLWALYPDWGWATADSVEALGLLRRFGSVTALNGHIHQIQRRVEGNVTFHSGRSTAYPQPAPGDGPGPGPLVLPPERLRSAIGVSSIALHRGTGPIAITDTALGAA